jgi:hypothetical protein
MAARGNINTIKRRETVSSIRQPLKIDKRFSKSPLFFLWYSSTCGGGKMASYGVPRNVRASIDLANATIPN